MNQKALTEQPQAVRLYEAKTSISTDTWLEANSPSRPPSSARILDEALDHVINYQAYELVEVFTDWDCHNKTFNLQKSSGGQQAYHAFEKEKTDWWSRFVCGGPQREFIIHIVDENNKEVMKIWRPPGPTLEIEAPPGKRLGRVVQLATAFSYKFNIEDVAGNVVLVIDGPSTICPCLSTSSEFAIFTPDRLQRIGTISKQGSGPRADRFGITYEETVSLSLKAILLGAVFLIDFMVTEK